MTKSNVVKETALITNLNDLLKLDVDAVQAYAIAIRQMDSAQRKQALRRYQADHKRHITQLKELIRAHGGVPLPLSHVPTGPFKLAMQALASLGGDRAVLMAFKRNERQVRDKYRRAASRKGLPADVARVVRRAAADEERHFRWAEKSLAQLGAGRGTMVGKVSEVMDVANARTVDVIEEAEKPLMTAMEVPLRGMRAVAKRPLKTAAVVAAVAGVAGAAVVARGKMR